MITDHEYDDDRETHSCAICGEVEVDHDDFDPTPEYFTYDGPRTSNEFEFARFEIGE